jgi:glutaryl-CoA dehydrogenase
VALETTARRDGDTWVILLENHVIRHMGDIEVLHTYEGTETMQTLIVGRDITGVGAFS